jgi:hypothetical protein
LNPAISLTLGSYGERKPPQDSQTSFDINLREGLSSTART